jgi:hypothetical protein
MEEVINYGLIEETELDPRDWRMGSISAAVKKILIDSGNWTEYLPTPEEQAAIYFDSLSCVTFSALNCIEMQAKFQGIDMNRSDRFTSKLSGTNKSGNSLKAVAMSVAELHGTVDESRWPFPRQQRTPAFDWEHFYESIPDDIQQEGLAWLDEWEVQYEWIPVSQIKEALKYGPIQVGVYAWPKRRADGMYDDAGQSRRNHAVTLFNVEDSHYEIFDHYKGDGTFIKKLVPSYDFKWAMQFTLIRKSDKPMPVLVLPEECWVTGILPRGQVFGLHVQGKLYVADSNINSTTFDVYLQWTARCNDFNNKRSITEEQWNSLPKFNLKNEQIA